MTFCQEKIHYKVSTKKNQNINSSARTKTILLIRYLHYISLKITLMVNMNANGN